MRCALPDAIAFAADLVAGVRAASNLGEVRNILEAVTREFDCRYYALIHHRNLYVRRPGTIDLKEYPNAVVDRLFDSDRYRRDPVIRGCFFAGAAFLWSDLANIVRLNRCDRSSIEFGATAGLNEGITVPYFRLGDCVGSCTFAGMRQPERASQLIGIAQMVGTFAFQAALRLSDGLDLIAPPPRLHPRPRDCVALVGRGLSNKEIARALALAPRTVDGYLTEARRLFDAHDRTELVTAAILAGEVGIEEIARRQPG